MLNLLSSLIGKNGFVAFGFRVVSWHSPDLQDMSEDSPDFLEIFDDSLNSLNTDVERVKTGQTGGQSEGYWLPVHNKTVLTFPG